MQGMAVVAHAIETYPKVKDLAQKRYGLDELWSTSILAHYLWLEMTPEQREAVIETLIAEQ